MKLVLKTKDSNSSNLITELTYELENIEFEYKDGELEKVFADVKSTSSVKYMKYEKEIEPDLFDEVK